jgi:cytochrome c-type biogenesis protein CcmH
LTAAVLFVLQALTASTVLAVEPHEILDDPVLEARAREISRQLRCMVCQNESIDSSNAEVAADLRRLVRERLTAGDSDQEIMDHVVTRYGDFVLMTPPFRARTILLWIGPFLLLLIGGSAIFFFVRNQNTGGVISKAPLTDEERRMLEEFGTNKGDSQ